MDIEKTETIPPRETLSLFWNSVRRTVYDLDVADSKLSEDHEKRIRRHYNQLLSNLNVPDVVTQMFQKGMLTPKEHEHLRQFHSTPIRASEELLNFVIISSKDVYECFLESLQKTKQNHVHQMLNSDDETVCLGQQSMSEHSRLIRQHYEWLTEKLDSDSGLLRTLYAREVLSHREYVQIISEIDQFVKNEKLLSIISRKSSEDFEKFKIALKETSQDHITNRLTEVPVGDTKQNVTTTVEKTLPSTCSVSSEKRIPPKPPPKTKRQPPPLPTSDSIKPSIEPRIHVTKTNKLSPEKRQNFSKTGTLKRQSVKNLDAKFRMLPNELQTEVSTKISLMHLRKSTDSIWKITLTKILEESRNIKSHNIVQSKTAEAYCETLKQEIVQLEHEYKITKNDIQREKMRTKNQLSKMQERVHELLYTVDQKEIEIHLISEKLKYSVVEVESLMVLLTEQAQAVTEKVSIIEELENKLNVMEAQARDRGDKLTEADLRLERTTIELKETKEELKETEAELSEFKAHLRASEKCIDDLKMLNERKEEELSEKLSMIETFNNQNYEEQLKETEEQLMSTQQKLTENEGTLRTTTSKLEETLEKLTETESKLNEYDSRIRISEKGTDNLSSKGEQRYKFPTLVQTIRTRAAFEEKKSVSGFTILDDELFVVSWESSEVDIFDSVKLILNRRWKMKELISPLDIGSCSRNKCLYIFDKKDRSGQLSEILRVDANGKLVKKWTTGDNWGYGLSVTDESNILLTEYNRFKLKEYSPDGQLIREIDLSVHADIHFPFHAIKLASGHFMVSHGDDLHRVCIVDEGGKLKKSFGGKPGSGNGQVNKPFYLAVDAIGFVMVADQMNNRVLLLDSELEFKKEILSKEKTHSIAHPTMILLDESNGRLFVSNETRSPNILIFDIA